MALPAVVFDRVGTNGAVKTWQHSSRAEAERDFERKCQAKLTGGYRLAKVLVGDHTAVRIVFKDRWRTWLCCSCARRSR
jgi:hypothetical protein